jgi:hypothetical protein
VGQRAGARFSMPGRTVSAIAEFPLTYAVIKSKGEADLFVFASALRIRSHLRDRAFPRAEQGGVGRREPWIPFLSQDAGYENAETLARRMRYIRNVALKRLSQAAPQASSLTSRFCHLHVL